MMLKPTSNPIDAFRREQDAAARASREALAAGGTQPYQAVDKLKRQIDQLTELFIRIPSNYGAQHDVDDWTIGTAGWDTVAQISIPRPLDKTRVVVSVTSSVSALAREAGLLSFRSRIVINGAASPYVQGQLESTGSMTRCSAYPSFVREIPEITGSVVTAQLQLGIDAAPYTLTKRASLSVLAAFSTI